MSHDVNDADVHLSDYHRQLFGRAERYYAALAAGILTRRKARRWPLPAITFTIGAALAFLLASLILPSTAAALPEKLAAPARPVAAIAPSRLSADAAAARSRSARSAADAAARRYEAVQARARYEAMLAREYQNPLRAVSGLVPERVDMGIDFGGYGPVYAIGPGVIQATYNGGWPGGGWICEYLTSGRDAGSSVYVAEDITASVYVGEQVTSATVLGSMWGGIETGWAQPGCAGNAEAGYYPGYPTAAGISYNGVLISVGAPSGTGVAGAGPLNGQGPGGGQGSSGAHHRCGWRCYPRNRAMDWALRQKGCWYNYGGTSCAQGFDCSGLVMEAYAHIGIHLPRTTYDMLADVGVRHYLRHIWWELVQVWHPRRGDLSFYGSGHVELDTKLHDTTFGAHDSGTQVGYAHWGWGWAPTAFYRVEVHRR